MENSFENLFIIFVTITVIYYLGYIKGFTKRQILDNQEIKPDDFAQQRPALNRYPEHEVRKAKLDQVGDLFHVFDADTDEYLFSGKNLTEILEAASKYRKKKVLYYFSVEDSNKLRQIDEQQSV